MFSEDLLAFLPFHFLSLASVRYGALMQCHILLL